MARGKKDQPERTPPTVSPQKGVELIERQIREGEALLSKDPLPVNDYSGWRTHTDGILKMVYGSASSESAQFFNAASAVGGHWVNPSEEAVAAERREKLNVQIVKLRAFVKILRDRVAAEAPVKAATTDSSGLHDTGVACDNGHVINSSVEMRPQLTTKFCASCGAKAVDRCAQCGTPIRGDYHPPPHVLIAGAVWRPPRHCHECGAQFPWTIKRAQALSDAIEELDDLKPDERQKLKDSVPDIIANTPQSDTAVMRFKKAFGKVGKVAGAMLEKVVVSVATETVKKQMGL